MKTPTPTAARPRFRLWLKLAISAIVLLATPLACLWYLSWSEAREFQALLAETDRLDPGWRLEELLAARPALPDERNSAKQAEKASSALIGPSNGGADLDMQIFRLQNVSLPAPLADALRKLLAREAGARAAALLLKDMPAGRFFVPVDVTWENYPSDRFFKLLELNRLLDFDALLAAADKNPAQAAASLRAGINVGRSVGDAPSLMSQLVAVACVVRSVAALERVLAQLELSPAELTAIQKLLEREVDEPRMVWALRGERAGQHCMLDALERDRIKRTAIVPPSYVKYAWLPNWIPLKKPIDRLGMLRASNEMVEAAKLPVERQLGEAQRLDAAFKTRSAFVQTMGGILSHCLSDHIADRTKLRCAIPALAAERYRQQHGAWPASLDALVQAGLLKAVPLDPYDGKALRFRRLADGLVIYSVGVDRIDNGGNIHSQDPKTPVSDIGFRLWDKGARRQTWTP